MTEGIIKKNEENDHQVDIKHYESKVNGIKSATTSGATYKKNIEGFYPKMLADKPGSTVWKNYMTNINTNFNQMNHQVTTVNTNMRQIVEKMKTIYGLNTNTLPKKRITEAETQSKKAMDLIKTLGGTGDLRSKIVEKAWETFSSEMKTECKAFDTKYTKEWFPHYHKWYNLNNPAPTRLLQSVGESVEDVFKDMKTVYQTLLTDYNKLTTKSNAFRTTWTGFITPKMIKELRHIFVDLRAKANFVQSIQLMGEQGGSHEMKRKEANVARVL